MWVTTAFLVFLLLASGTLMTMFVFTTASNYPYHGQPLATDLTL